MKPRSYVLFGTRGGGIVSTQQRYLIATEPKDCGTSGPVGALSTRIKPCLNPRCWSVYAT